MNMSLALAYRGNINKIFIWVGTLSNNEDKAYEVSRKYLKEQGETFVQVSIVDDQRKENNQCEMKPSENPWRRCTI